MGAYIIGKGLSSGKSRFENAGDRLCPGTERVRDTRAVLQLRVDTNRIDRRYALGTLVPNGRTGFDP